jgi:hypothetical protein
LPLILSLLTPPHLAGITATPNETFNKKPMSLAKINSGVQDGQKQPSQGCTGHFILINATLQNV